MDMADVIETKLIDPPSFPLRSYTEEIDGMVSSIKERGLINPIVVRPVGNRFEVVAGAIRFEAIKRLRWTRVPCIVRELRDRDALEVALTENIQRKTMNPLEEAEAFKRYIDTYGRGSETQLASKIGKSQEYISHRLSLLRLPEVVKQEIMRRRINASIAMEIATLQDEQLQIKVSEEVANHRLDVRGFRKLTQALKSSGVPPPPILGSAVLVNGGLGSSSSLPEASEPDFAKKPALNDASKAISKRRELQKAILVYKLTMSRLASLISTLPEDSEVREVLVEHRVLVHNMANSLIHLKVKTEKLIAKTVP
ncbi:MAG TPA: ParB/RepB/Spo0J family partition protein [Nitrososphaerales archaeon]|nr:ParB/RepB/Spo0J family partition protein [Nitrososphaerales archaeon]